MGVAERRERERAERREHIIDAAEKVFFEVGPVAATMDDIARAAELSKGTLYLYFKSKDELYLAIASRGMRRQVEAMQEAIDEAAAAGECGLSQLRAVSRANQRFGHDNPEHLRTMLAWMISGFNAPDTADYPDYHAIVSRMFRLVVSVVESGKADGSIRKDVSSLQVVMQLWGGAMGMWLLNFNRDRVSQRLQIPCDFDELVPSFAAMLLGAIQNPELPGGSEAE